MAGYADDYLVTPYGGRNWVNARAAPRFGADCQRSGHNWQPQESGTPDLQVVRCPDLERERQLKDRTSGDCILRPYMAAVELHNSLADRKPQTGARLCRSRPLAPVKRAEDGG